MCLLGLLAATAASAQLPPAPVLRESPWNGDWVLSRTRNTKEVMEGAAEDYRFRLAPDGHIRWEIPSLNEVVEGRVDGQPMMIRRPGAEGQTLALTPQGPYTLRYAVAKAGKALGEGRMTLVEQGKAWVDITQPAGRPDFAHVVIYVRPGDADK